MAALPSSTSMPLSAILLSEPTPAYSFRPSWQQAARPMPAGLEADELLPRRRDAVRAGHIGEGHHAVGVADIERVAQQRHAERLVQSLHENFTLFRDPIAIGVAQQRDAVRALAEGGGTPHRRL